MRSLRLFSLRLPRPRLVSVPGAPAWTSRSFHLTSNPTPKPKPNAHSMAASPFSQAVFECMRTLYPECLADKTFDNTGLLLEAPALPSRRNKNSVLLTIDLTTAVADEAIEQGHSVVVAYHPIIFRGLKSITLQDTQQRSLLRLAAHGVSVYSPHTAVDVVPGGMGDWLADIVTDGTPKQTVDVGESSLPARSIPQEYDRYYTTEFPTIGDLGDTSATLLSRLDHTRSVITASPAADMENANKLTKSSGGFNASNTGAGRLINFSTPIQLNLLIDRIGNALGWPKSLSVAVPQGTKEFDHVQIKTVGVCPGSGASVMRACRPAPDLVVTGEMSHHDALAITERGGSVITLFHSNSERGYLSSVMKPKLESKLSQVWAEQRDKVTQQGGEPLQDTAVAVKVSQQDRDPFMTVLAVNENYLGEK